MSAPPAVGEPAPLVVRPTVVIREQFSGDVLVHPVADPSLAAFGSEASALEELRLFLCEHLAEADARELARLVLPPETTIQELELRLVRHDLPRETPIPHPVSVPIVCVPAAGGALWCIPLALAHTFHVEAGADLRARAESELNRIIGAREMTAQQWLELLPGRSHRLEALEVPVRRADRGGVGAASTRQTQRKKKAERVRARKLLLEIGAPIGEWAVDTPALVAREEPLRTLRALIDGEERRGVVVSGEELVGKSALIGAALRDRPDVFVTSAAQLIAGQSFFGQWQQRLHDVLAAVETLDAVIVFDDLGDLFSDRDGSTDIASLVRPWLERGRIRLVGELRTDQLATLERTHAGFYESLQPLRLSSLGPAETRAVLDALTDHHRRTEPGQGTLDKDAIQPLIDLCQRYLPYAQLPGKAVRVVEELRAVGRRAPIERGHVLDAFARRTGIPAFLLRRTAALKLADLTAVFERRVVGQRAAIRHVAETLCTVKAELQPAHKPLASFLFVGPTGVGKTEVARALAGYLFSDEARLVRFDMSEFTDPFAADRLIGGTTAGEGLLTRRVRQQPFCVVLLDELEKAHPAVFDLLLQVCGEGRLTDARGKTTSFQNALIIMTSNLGAAERRRPVGLLAPEDGLGSSAAAQAYYADQVDRCFRPELVNRLDRIVVFEPLGDEDIQHVAQLVVDRVRLRDGLRPRGVELTLAEGVLERLAAEGHAPEHGARALRRHLEDKLVAPVAAGLAALGSPENRRVDVCFESPEQGGGLRVSVTGAGSRLEQRALQDALAVGDLRARAGVRLEAPEIEAVRASLVSLTAELAMLGRSGAGDTEVDPRIAADVGRATREHRRLDRIASELDAWWEQLLEAEELAMLALFEGEPVRPFRDDAEDAFEELTRSELYARLATLRDPDRITLLVRELDKGRALDLWLPPLLDEAQRRGWQVIGHLEGDPRDPTDVEWPPTRRVGPPRGAAALRRRVLQPKRKGRTVILRVQGALARALLALECDLFSFEGLRGPGRREGERFHLHVVNIASRTDLKEADWERPCLQVGGAPPRPLELRGPAARAYHFGEGVLQAPGDRASYRIPFTAYWSMFELIACTVLRRLDVAGEGRHSIYQGLADREDELRVSEAED